MCGFVGVVSSRPMGRPEIAKIQRASDAIRHRGPDDEGFVFVSGGSPLILRGNDTLPELDFLGHIHSAPQETHHHVGLASRRLSIIDLTVTGHMPMLDPETGNWITYNGEIYNYVELRRELEALDHRFQSTSDTEVILRAYEEWGEECLHRFNGMWTFAIWDRKRAVLFCARDRFGEKQLYFCAVDGETWVSSEITSLLVGLDRTPPPNPKLLWDFLVYGLADHTSETTFTGISQLLPGECMTLRPDGRPEARRWYEIPERDGAKPASLEENARKLRELLADSVRLRLRSDVPVASFLSGGLDSSSIVALADRELAGLNGHSKYHGLRTYTNVYGDGHRFDESPLVRALLKTTKVTTPAFITAQEARFESHIMEMVRCQEQPFHNSSIFASFELLRRIGSQDKIKVILTGEASDELLAGYWRVYLPLQLASMLSRGKVRSWAAESSRWGWRTALPATLKGAFRALPPQLRSFAQRFRSPVPGLMKREFFEAHVERDQMWMDQWRQGTLEGRLQADVHRYNLPQLLRHLDRNSMHFSVETRIPFLDYRLVEFALSLPAEQKIHNGYTKAVFRKAVDGLLPSEITWNPRKLGFGMAEQLWFTGVLDLMDASRLNDFVSVDRLRADCRSKRVEQAHWLPVSVGLWLNSFYSAN